MPSFAVNAGMTSQQGALALGLSNASSAIGRIVIGAFADRLGHINGYSICMILTPLFTLLIWPFATSFGVLCLFGILFGFFSGGFISLFPTVIVALFGPVNLGSRMGSIFTSTLAGNLAGSPVAGAILGTTQTVGPDGQPLFNYLTVILYSGLTQLAAGLIIFALRFRVANWVLKKRL
jgi:MFS family permease